MNIRLLVIIGLLLSSSIAMAAGPSSRNGVEPILVQGNIPPENVPPVDLTKHNVPLDQVYFDTFRRVNRAVPLDQAPKSLIDRLRDAIPPIHNPKYDSASEAHWLHSDDIVLGYVGGDRAWAYPIKILNYHEIVNETIGGEEVLISYCPLCYSGIVFSRRLDDRTLTFGNTSALYESDMVMLDYETGSYWWQVAGEAIVGELTGEKLKVLPSMTLRWGEWQNLYPDTLVLSRDTGFSRPYEADSLGGYVDYLKGGSFAFPVSEAARDRRLPPATIILAVKMGGDTRAYPVVELGRKAIMDTLGGQEITVFTDPDGLTGGVYQPTVGDRKLTFETREGRFYDRETGSTWDLAGRAVEGSLKGSQLEALPSKIAFWFSIATAEPGITVYEK